MKNLGALALLTLFGGSFPVHAAFINLPETAEFNINADPWTYELNYTGSMDDGDPTTEDFTPFIEFEMESESFYDYTDEVGFSINFGLQFIFLGAGSASYNPGAKAPIEKPVLGELYKYTVTANIAHLPIGCGEPCPDLTTEQITASTWISFFDGDDPAVVPAPPTGPILAAGLVAIYLRRKQA